jgi:SAM-dependent methyltransferase
MSPCSTSYAFDNEDPEAAGRHALLAEILDPVTFPRLASLGDLTAKSCLEIGAGGGSVARWLANRVGPIGRVLATDLDTRHLPVLGGYEIRAHDLVTDPLPAGPWDLIHARLVLGHIRKRHEVLRRLAEALAPGGWLVVEEWVVTLDGCVLTAPDGESRSLYEAYIVTLRHVLGLHGVDWRWGATVPEAMLAAGLVDVDPEITCRSWPGGSAGALLGILTVRQLREEFRAEGWGDERIKRLFALMSDSRLMVRTHLLHSTVGRRAIEQ